MSIVSAYVQMYKVDHIDVACDNIHFCNMSAESGKILENIGLIVVIVIYY